MLTVFSDVQVFAVKKIQLIAISTEFIPQAIWKCYSQVFWKSILLNNGLDESDMLCNFTSLLDLIQLTQIYSK